MPYPRLQRRQPGQYLGLIIGGEVVEGICGVERVCGVVERVCNVVVERVCGVERVVVIAEFLRHLRF